MLFAVAGEKQIYKECNSFHADMEALDQHVHACLSIDGRGSPYIYLRLNARPYSPEIRLVEPGKDAFLPQNQLKPVKISIWGGLST